jgi:hypothetical protein
VPDYWQSCGYRLLATGADGRLTLTDDYLRSLLLRPELAPIVESCAAERALHERLLAAPRATVAESELTPIVNPDTRENFRIWLRFRQRLVAAPSIEAAYVALFRDGVDVPPLFVAQLTQILLRHILGVAADPMEARAAEMLFRTQKIAVLDDGAVMAADERAVEHYATSAGFGSLGELLQRNRTPVRTVDLDVLDADNAATYWERDERHDLGNLNRGRPVGGLPRAERDRAFSRRRRRHPPAERDRRPALGVARRTGRRGERAAERPVQSRRRRRHADGTASLPVRADVRGSRRHAARHCWPSRLSRDGDG